MNRRFFPVIHVESVTQAKRNAIVASLNGADGVFLINHRINHRKLFAIAEEVRAALPQLWLGVNALDLPLREMFECCPEYADAIWADSCDNSGDFTPADVDRILSIRRMRTVEFELFGGFAFKHQHQPNDIPTSARLAAKCLSSVTTSGMATGVAADVQRVNLIRANVTEARLAIASGITPENVHEYLPFVDDFLVATGISKSFTELDAEKTRALAEIIHKL